MYGTYGQIWIEFLKYFSCSRVKYFWPLICICLKSFSLKFYADRTKNDWVRFLWSTISNFGTPCMMYWQKWKIHKPKLMFRHKQWSTGENIKNNFIQNIYPLHCTKKENWKSHTRYLDGYLWQNRPSDP